jgi:hypothetical protein
MATTVTQIRNDLFQTRTDARRWSQLIDQALASVPT